MTGVEIALAGGAVAGKKAIEGVVQEIVAAVSTSTKKLIQNWKAAKGIPNLCKHINNVRMVKTLWQVDKAVDLKHFYCDSHVCFGKDRKRIVCLNDMGDSQAFLIEGIAGQGKSIFLRYLCATELVRGQYIPLFLELRRIQSNQTLLQHILAGFKALGLKLTPEGFEDLASSGRLIILLDAFDEVKEEAKERILAEVEELIANNDKLRVIVTSRPHSGLEMSPRFQVARLSDLQGDEFKAVIYKLVEDCDLADQLIKQVVQHKGDVKEVLATPLLVTLLILNYKSFQRVPDQLSEFYDSIFQLLLQRHDGSKPGYRRHRRCKFSDTDYRRVFEAFCFIAKGCEGKQMSHATTIEAVKKALKEADANESAQEYLADLVSVTCLLLKDGEEYRFIHKSVQEYYAASFIKQKPDTVAEKFYRKIYGVFPQSRFLQELRFLQEIDQYRYHKYGVIEFVCRFLDTSTQGLEDLTSTKVRPIMVERIFQIQIAIHTDDNSEHGRKAIGVHSDPLTNLGPLAHTCLMHIFQWELSSVIEAVKNKSIEGVFPENGKSCDVTISQINAAGLLNEQIEKLVTRLSDFIVKMGTEGIRCIKSQEREDSILELLK